MKAKFLNLGSKGHVYSDDFKLPLYLQRDAQMP